MNQRGQTAYDYLLGVTLLLVVILVSLSFFPQIFSPFVDPVSTDQEKMADRTATELIKSSSTMTGDQTLNLTALEAEVNDESGIEQLKERAGVPEFRNIRITVQNNVSSPEIRAGDGRSSQPTATVVRQVRGTTGEYSCKTGCQLVVRVW
jgi:hypothetical protein